MQRVKLWMSSRNRQKWADKVEVLKWELKSIRENEKRMSGSAFVTFRDARIRKLMLADTPPCWQCGGSAGETSAYFNFGHPPFASVTLRCLSAPHPSDVIWENLHVTYVERISRFWIGTLLLLIFMVAVVTPVTVTTQLNAIIPELRERSKLFGRNVQRLLGITLPGSPELWTRMSFQLPTVIVLVINSMLLPMAIGIISITTKSHTRSKIEVNMMNLNFVFLVTNQLLIPLLGLTGLPALLEFLEFRLTEGSDTPSLLQLMDGSLLGSPGLFSLRYLLNCAFLTNASSLLNLPQLFFRSLTEQKDPWVFAWGFWYASTLSILATTIALGVLVPSLLPCGALFFALKYRIDRYNLANRVFSCGPESQGCFIPRVVHIMRMIVAVSWFLIGGSVLLTLNSFYTIQAWKAPVPLDAVKTGSGFLVFAALVLFAFCSYSKAAALHSAKFQMPRFSSDSLNISSVDLCLDYLFGSLSDVGNFEEEDLNEDLGFQGRRDSEDLTADPRHRGFLGRRDTEETDVEVPGSQSGLIWNAMSTLQSFEAST